MHRATQYIISTPPPFLFTVLICLASSTQHPLSPWRFFPLHHPSPPLIIFPCFSKSAHCKQPTHCISLSLPDRPSASTTTTSCSPHDRQCYSFQMTHPALSAPHITSFPTLSDSHDANNQINILLRTPVHHINSSTSSGARYNANRFFRGIYHGFRQKRQQAPQIRCPTQHTSPDTTYFTRLPLPPPSTTPTIASPKNTPSERTPSLPQYCRDHVASYTSATISEYSTHTKYFREEGAPTQ